MYVQFTFCVYGGPNGRIWEIKEQICKWIYISKENDKLLFFSILVTQQILNNIYYDNYIIFNLKKNPGNIESAKLLLLCYVDLKSGSYKMKLTLRGPAISPWW